ncbi:MAG: UDP-N-acetylglucosamine 1-carboxyvinyltransferase [Eubacteriales bacterium]|nr:UDP-N-acetylglucosamine 1-carboxyvinyltransferase [Eubacteriales bacterium]
MGKYIINGGKTLKGDVFISGAKNSVLPILASTVLNGGVTVLKNVPIISDTIISIDILKNLGCFVGIQGDKLIIDSSNINNTDVSEELVKKMRSSIIFLGSLLARFKNATISYPGGCKLGKRPIDFHLKGFEKLNIKIKEDGNIIQASTDEIIGNKIELPFASVGATQNIMLASIFAEGETIIYNAAKEPEIIDMQNFLNEMGAEIFGAGTDEITIKGVKELKKYCEYTIMPDRIEAGTFLCLAACNGGDITIKNVIPEHLEYLTNILQKMNCKIEKNENSIKLSQNGKIKNIEFLETAPYPLFPTDLQPQLMVALCLAEGDSIIKESIFEARNMHIPELNKMGANIKEDNETFIIKGIKKFNASQVFSKDLRGGAALIMAALCAEGESVIFGSEYVERGYENIEEKLRNLGADIKYIKD